MTKQPEALRKADLLAEYLGADHPAVRAISAELRRLHAEVERERTARIAAQTQLEQTQDERNRAHITARREVAEELRRLHALNGELLEALKTIMNIDSFSALTEADVDAIDAQARAAIKKAEGKV